MRAAGEQTRRPNTETSAQVFARFRSLLHITSLFVNVDPTEPCPRILHISHQEMHFITVCHDHTLPLTGGRFQNRIALEPVKNDSFPQKSREACLPWNLDVSVVK